MGAKHAWIGFNDMPEGASSRARELARFTAPMMLGIALLALPSFYFEDLQSNPARMAMGPRIDALIFVAFAVETASMAALSAIPWRYLAANWLKPVIVLVSGLGLLQALAMGVPGVHLLHLAYIGLLFAWLLDRVRHAFSGNAIPYAIVLGTGTVLLAGLGFYRIEPTVHSYGQGVWMAFSTAATSDFGDVVPTTPASRVLAAVVVVLGYAVFSLITARIAALFVGAGEKRAQQDMHCDIQALREEVRELRRELAMDRTGLRAGRRPTRRRRKS